MISREPLCALLFWPENACYGLFFCNELLMYCLPQIISVPMSHSFAPGHSMPFTFIRIIF